MSTGEDFGTALAGLTRASRARLAEHWAEYFGAAPPPLSQAVVWLDLPTRTLVRVSPTRRENTGTPGLAGWASWIRTAVMLLIWLERRGVPGFFGAYGKKTEPGRLAGWANWIRTVVMLLI